MAENKNENQQSQEMMDKTYVVEGFDPSKLQNADVNISQYWDDSSEANYNNPSLWGWENTKYTGENTLGSQVAYNPNATVEGLDPNYLYWQEAQMQNSKEANYIAKRNDEIASALYNAWKTSIQDVNDFLDSQRGFYNSVWNERANTVTAVWKRIGQIAKQNEKSDEPQADPNKTPDEWNNDALNNMQSDLNKSTAWELYGKVTADQDTHIKTLEDENSVYKSMNQARINAFKSLQSMSDESLAAAIIGGEMSGDSQAMRDLMQYDPAKYESVKLAEKQIRGQMNINTITSGEGDYVTSATNGKSWLNNDIADFANSNWTSLTSAASILSDVNSTLSSNQSFNSANETMDALESDMATLQNRLKNLKKEANTIFKGDVPQYLVNAYVANRTAEIQDQLSVLETRYNYAQTRANQEWSRTMDVMNYNLKVEELSLKKQAASLEDYATRQWIMIDWYKATNGSSTSSETLSGTTVQTTSLSREEIEMSVDQLIEACTNGQLGNAQCAAWIQSYYLPTLGVELWRLSTWDQKKGICNEDATYAAKKWDLVIMTSKSKPENGHIAIVDSIDWEYMTYLDWNGELWADGKWTEEPKLRTKKMSDMWIYGYYNPTKTSGEKWTGRFGQEYDTSKYSQWNTLTAEEKEIVKWILNYQIDPTQLAKSGTENGKTNYKVRAAAVALWGDDYEESNYKENYNIVTKWNNANEAWGELSRNATAMDELFQLYNIYKEEFIPTEWINIGGKVIWFNGNWDIKAINAVSNWIADQLWEWKISTFRGAVDIAASEIAWALKGNASPTEDEIKNVKSRLSTSNSVWQMDAIIKEYAIGIYKKMVSEAQAYEKVTGRKPYNIYSEVDGSLPTRMKNYLWLDLWQIFNGYDSGKKNIYDVTPVGTDIYNQQF